jgi:hypothetical protein
MPHQSLFTRLKAILPAVLLLACGGGGGGQGSGGGGGTPPVAVSLQPLAVDLESGDSQAFSASVSNAPSSAVAWQVMEAGGGAISPSGLYTAPDADGTFHVRATAAADSRATAEAAVRVKRRVTVTVSPDSANLVADATQAFTATVANTPNTAVTWSASGGTITPAGLYTAPSTPGTYTVQATSVADPRRSGLATVTVGSAPAAPVIANFTATPSTLNPGQTSTLAWSVTGATSLSIDQGVGAVTGTTSKAVSPAATTTYTLTATNAAGSATASVTVTVTQRPVIASFTATPATLNAGQSSTLAWSVTGATGLTLDQGIGSVTGTSFVVTPAATTVYRLTATNAAGSVSATATVTVQPPSPASCSAMDLGVGADLKGTQVFASTSEWNRDISADPVDPNSATLIATIGTTKGLHGDYGAGLYNGGKIGIPYVVVGGQAKVPINFTAYGDESDPGPYPVPPSAPIEGDPAVPNDGDRHVLVLDRDTCTLYELYRAFPVGNGTSWNADSAAVWDLKGDTKRPLGWTSADAAGLPVFPGLVRWDEVSAGEIRHALRFTANLTRKAFTPPATHWASSSTDPARPPMGMRVRLKASYDISTFSASTQVVLRALKKYGMILADNGSDWFISGAPDERWNNTAIAELSRVKGSDLEVVRMGTVYTTIPSGTPPAITAFTASPNSISAGQSSTLSFTVTGASTVIISPEVGVVTGGATSVAVRPGATTTYTLTATNAGGASTRTVTVTVTGSVYITPDDPGTADLRFTLHSGQDVHPISRWIYGYNGGTWDASMAPGTTLGRLGGNRWTAYNWETNASNAGTDWGPYSNDGYLSGSSTPGEAVRPYVANAQAANAGIIVTVPMQGWASADKNGNVDITQPVSTRFLPTQAKKGSSYANPPSLTDGRVCLDEFVWWLDGRFPSARSDPNRPVFHMLDNEPDLWYDTHREVQRSKLRYDQLIPASIALSAAIKDVVPEATVMGPASYGWNGFVNLQDAPDANGRDFLETYLAELKTASDTQGRRLLDVLDLHWYSEAQGGGQRVVGGDNSSAVAAARIQAPRSLWDATYTETSWITQYSTLGPIRLIPRILGKIAAKYPGTRLSFSEYNHGGEDHISGGLAQADTLGIFGREGVFAANVWPVTSNRAFSYGAFRLFRNYDGAGAAFGDTSFRAVSSDDARGSVYGSLVAGDASRVVVLLLNKDTAARTCGFALTHTQLFGRAEVYQLTASSPIQSGSAVPQRQADLTLTLRNALRTTLPALSATVLVLRP